MSDADPPPSPPPFAAPPAATSRTRRGVSSLHRREASVFLATWTTALITGCVPGPATGRDGLQTLDRFEYRAPVRKADGVRQTLRVSAIRAGDSEAPRVIYVHGTPGSAIAFADYILDPVAGFESISIDRPGFGRTDAGRPWPRFVDQAAAIAPLLEARDGRWPILVGHSLGGPIIARVAADHPDRVGAIVILAGSLDPELETPRWFNRLADTLLMRPLIGRTLRTSNDEILAAVAETRALEAVLDRVQCPVVIIHGTEDGLVPVGNVDYMQRRFADLDVRTIVLEGEGHFLPWRQEDLVREVIESLGPGPRPGDASGG